jgi:hypothetical protein
VVKNVLVFFRVSLQISLKSREKLLIFPVEELFFVWHCGEGWGAKTKDKSKKIKVRKFWSWWIAVI